MMGNKKTPAKELARRKGPDTGPVRLPLRKGGNPVSKLGTSGKGSNPSGKKMGK